MDERIRNSNEGRRGAEEEEEDNTPIPSRPRESIVTRKGKGIAQSSKTTFPSSSSSSDDNDDDDSDNDDDDDGGGGDYGGNNEGGGGGHSSLPPGMSWAQGGTQYYATQDKPWILAGNRCTTSTFGKAD